ncbi:polymer-forming cytoskeletal protein [Halioxenophilus sp. WMMB6]|uniref:bactofilin family protein n=1 Tax=Halioxenophilus sp. WMMB6 TaxID=3073815 RepID=UPI00295EE4B1|nr:polymer-forming cytoskeletal protein [Halioxenophilus sp. WMMB6]
MFGGKKVSETTSGSPGTTTLISKNTEIVGDMVFSGNLVVEGKVSGNILAAAGSKANLRLLESGEVHGEIRVPTIIINGKVSGDVYSSEHIELAARAVVDGNVHYNLIEMVKGAQVNGNLVFSKVTEGAEPQGRSGPVTKLKPMPEPADLKSVDAKPINA